MSLENKHQIPSSELLFRLIRELEISSDVIFYPEHSRTCETVGKLHILLSKCEEQDINVIIVLLQSLLDIRHSAGGELQCCLK